MLQFRRASTVIASWAYPDAIACAVLKRLLPFTLFIQCLGTDVNYHAKHPFRRKQLASAFSAASSVITVSQALARAVLAVQPNAKAVTIYNGVNFDLFRISNEKVTTPCLVFVGNLLRTKGVVELIEAFAGLPDQNLRLTLIGDGPARNLIQELLQKHGLQNRVSLLGRLPHSEVARILPDYTALVLPSYSEGVPNVVVEALAAGLPVITTTVGGIPEVVKSDCGVLVPPRDVIKLQTAIADVISREWNPEALRSSVANLTWEKNAVQVAELVSDT